MFLKRVYKVNLTFGDFFAKTSTFRTFVGVGKWRCCLIIFSCDKLMSCVVIQ